MIAAPARSRSALIAMLVAAEIALIGIIAAVVHPGMFSPWQVTPLHVSPIALPAHPHAIAFGADMDALTVADSDGRVDVSASSDGRIHVSDADATVERDGSVMRISSDRHLDLAVPRDARLTISQCDGATITGLSGALDVHCDDGDIVASGLNFRDAGSNASLHSDDGRVSVAGAFGPGNSYDFSSDDGSVSVALAPQSDASIDASTDDGSIAVDGDTTRGDDASSTQAQVGNGSSAMRVHSGDGAIEIHTNGAR